MSASTPAWVLRTPLGQPRPWVAPTALGLVFMLVAVGLEVDALSDPNLVKMALAAVALSLAMGELIGIIRRTLKVQLLEVRQGEVRAGQPFALTLTLANRGRTDTLVRVTVEGRKRPAAWAWVPARGQVALAVPLAQAPSRGRHRWPPFRVRVHGPLGLAQGFAVWVPSDEAAQPLRVWPAPWAGPLPTWPLGPEAGTTARWSAPGAEPGGTAAPTDQTGPEGWLRDWRQGDRLGHIAHKASAKRDRWLVRSETPVARGGGEVHLTWRWALAQTGDEERALTLLGAVAEAALGQGRWVSLAVPGAPVGLGRGTVHRAHVLDALSEVTL